MLSNTRWELDVPVYVQIRRWIGKIVVHGDMGTSLRTQQAITPQILKRIPLTFELGLMGILVGLVISLPIGVYAAIRQDTITDYILRSIAILLISVPSFWIGTLVIYTRRSGGGGRRQWSFISFFKKPFGESRDDDHSGAGFRSSTNRRDDENDPDDDARSIAPGLHPHSLVERPQRTGCRSPACHQERFYPIVTMIGAGIPTLIAVL